MTSVARRSIPDTFAALRAKKQIALMPFIAAGYPDLMTTREILPALEAGGADLIEIGIPFSDPIADGPVIQEAFTASLARGTKVSDVLNVVRDVRGKLSIPLVAMVSYSIVFRYGIERFGADAVSAGFDGVILPDLPPPEAQGVCEKLWNKGLLTTLLTAPTTSPERRRTIAELSTGFAYYMSISGITGERDALPADIASNVQAIRAVSDRPVCVGFGISQPKHLKQLTGVADGAIVGSAFVRRIKQHAPQGCAAVTSAVEQYCRELLSEVR